MSQGAPESHIMQQSSCGRFTGVGGGAELASERRQEERGVRKGLPFVSWYSTFAQRECST